MTASGFRKFLTRLGCFASLVAVALVSPGLIFGMMLIAGSERTIYERASSPDGWHEARVQFDDAGAVSSFSRLVFLKHRWNPSDAPLLSCRALYANGEPPIRLRWQDNTTLIILYQFAPQGVLAHDQWCGPIRIVVRSPEADSR